ncbi:MAG: DMT family transporter [Rhodobacteraceae bacterium]|jgi:drug/metabolite transporter (DMT)-like permease|nr:DMT family transporter [Paracoccaceae bacterium]
MTAIAAPRAPDRILPGVALMLAFCLIAPLIDAFAKLAAGTGLPTAQITAARFAVQAALMVPIATAMGVALQLPPGTLRLTVLRAVLLIGSTYSFVAAVAAMPIADALAIAFVEPFLLLLAGWALLGERVGPQRIAACLIGFAGALLVIRPAFAAFGAVALWPLATAAFFAAYMLVTRALSARVHPVAMQAHTAIAGSLICLPALALGAALGTDLLTPVAPGALGWAWLAGVGVAATVSHMAITLALRFAPSATLAPLHYLEILGAVALGWAIFGDFPEPLTWAGIAVISASGLFIIHRERLAARPALTPIPAQRQAPPAPDAAPRAAGSPTSRAPP